MKKAKFLASIIPTVAVTGVQADEGRLYGEPTSLKTTAEAKQVYQQNKLRLGFSPEQKNEVAQISELGNKILLDEASRQAFLTDEEHFFSSKGLDYASIKNLDSVRALRLFAQDNFRMAMVNRDYRNVLIELQAHGFLGADDLTRLKDNFKVVFSQDHSIREALIKDVRILQDNKLSLNDSLSLLSSTSEITPSYFCTAFSFCLAVANAAAVSNAFAVAVAVAWCGVKAWGCQLPGPGVEEGLYVGKLALSDDNIRDNKEFAYRLANNIGSEQLMKEVSLDIVKAEIFAYYDAAYEVGLIATEEDRDLLVRGIFEHIKQTYLMEQKVNEQ
ncbi:hypothetical protein C3B51_12230 [Pseudoalteromonas rubra]|uniref:Uncharacterized protein n=1 Tax=Pseudoalteromonas rubra TaxID=43658 RepID=A0A4Q7EC68_9GAMM|nr:hypothetical protein [Pseudoalteromonas rubra]RZM80323.1 hypothetical protein C3B51_12230 [Pseudoalteromonas rubra]